MKRRSVFIVQGIIFIFLMIYFTRIVGLQPFDGDDWRYIGSIRMPFPLWGSWNPTRVLPEVLMPIGGYIAAFFIYPISGEYVWSISFVESAIISLFVVLMLYMFYRFLINRIKVGKKIAIAGELLFLLSFFLLFKHVNHSSYPAFWTVDLACDFFYVIPGLLNATLILFMLQYTNFVDKFAKFNNLQKGLFVVGLYFTLFSNTQLSIILATFSFMEFISICFQKQTWNKNVRISIINVLKSTWIYLVILVIWFTSIIFDLNGQRAANVSSTTKGTIIEKIIETFQQFIVYVKAQNKEILILFLMIIVVVIIVNAIELRRQNDSGEATLFLKISINALICWCISFAYLILAYAKAGSQYANRPDAMWALTFFLLFAANMSFIYLINKINIVKITIPLILILEAILAFNFNYPPVFSNNVEHDAMTVQKVNEYIINQVVNADKEGKTTVVVKVPVDEKNSPKIPTSNWPHSYAMANFLQDTLYNHHLTRTRMHIIFKPDKTVNKELYVNTEKEQIATPLE